MLTNVGSVERNYLKLTRESAGNAIAVKLAQFTGREVCADNGRLLQIESRIDNMIETRKRELIDNLGTEIINQKKIALGVSGGIVGGGGSHTVTKAAAFKIRNPS